MVLLGVALMAAAIAQGEAKAEPGAQAAPAASATMGATVAEKPAKPKKVCVEEERMGSHFRQRICATPEEWKRRREADSAAMSPDGATSPSK